jgi:hypothetical protein
MAFAVVAFSIVGTVVLTLAVRWVRRGSHRSVFGLSCFSGVWMVLSQKFAVQNITRRVI